MHLFNAAAHDKNYTKGDDVELSSGVEEKIDKIADEYYEKTKKKIHLTDGNRSASDQADRIYNKIKSGEDVTKLYTDQASIKAVKKAYDDGLAAEKGKVELLADMTKVIQGQVDKGVYLSSHLSNKAVDVRYWNMSEAQRKIFKEIAGKHATKVLHETKPADHWHLQF